ASSAAALESATQGWFFDAQDRRGTLHVKAPKQDIRAPLGFAVHGLAMAATDDAFPAAPALGRALPADAMVVVNRPAEEPGHALEQAFDGNPATWFRTVRSQTVKSGAHEWTVGFTERRLVDGIEIAPRSDANWKHGQVRDYEIYIADTNGAWGQPVKRGQLTLSKDTQTIAFPATVGRLLRFRVLSTQKPDGSGAAALDPMVTAVAGGVPARAFDAALPVEVAPITLSEFRVLEQRVPEGQELRRYLSELALPKNLGRDRPASKASEMRMNGLRFNKGIGMGPADRLDLQLAGPWTLLRADLGVDDSCRSAGGLRFQVWSGERLLYDSGLVVAPAVVKPEIDVRGLGQLSLRTLGASGPQPLRTCGNWANAVLTGTEGATLKLR
ncbi:MAG: NPCBM/NEW2 domain-containing protein, partial [Telluria sp.]